MAEIVMKPPAICPGCGDPASLICHNCHTPICAREAAVFNVACPLCNEPWFFRQAEIVVMATCDECGEDFPVEHECQGKSA